MNFVEHLRAFAPGSLPHLEFAVLALGDTSYDQFCQCGADVDTLFETLSGKRLADRIDCDVDFEGNAVIHALSARVAA